jgi:serine/threonine-protein kinase
MPDDSNQWQPPAIDVSELNLPSGTDDSSDDQTQAFYPTEKSHKTLGKISVSHELWLSLNGISSAVREDDAADPGSEDAARVPLSPLPKSRYLVGEEIGHGGMGVVYEAWDSQLQRRTAIKLLRHEERVKQGSLPRFFREARIASRLNHPGILSVHDFDVAADGQAFIVMGLLHGVTLSESLSRVVDRAAELPRFFNIFIKVCQAIAYAHAKGIIHRDLKPSNIMIGDFGEVTILDWGLAKVIGEAAPPAEAYPDPIAGSRLDNCEWETVAGTVFGTLAYLAPEQARGEVNRIDQRSDIFALGSILCEILTGKPPFCGETMAETYKQAVKGDISKISRLLDGCKGPRSIVGLAKKCLSPKRRDRPVNVGEIIDVVSAFLESGQRRAEQDLIRFFDLSLDLFCIANFQGFFTRVNENFPRCLGYTADELVSRQFVEFVHPDDYDKTLVEIEKLSQGVPTIQFRNRYRHADGHFIWLEWNARSVTEEAAIYAVARDVTDQVDAIDARFAVEEKLLQLAQIVDCAEDAIISNDPNGIVLTWNAGAEKIFGYSHHEMVGESLAKLIPPDLQDEEQRVLEALKEGKRLDHFETVRLHKDGRRVDISVTISPINDSRGEVIGASKIARDISHHKRLSEAFEKNHCELLDFADTANIPLHWVDRAGRILWANQSELDFLGYSRDEYIGQPVDQFHADRQAMDEILERLVRGDRLGGFEAKLIAKGGEIKRVLIFSSAYFEQGEFQHTRCFTIHLKDA